MDFDPDDPGTIADPFPILRALRDRDPVFRSAALGGWIVTRYEDVASALRDPRLSSDRISPFFRTLSDADKRRFESLRRSLGNWSVFSDPPDHTRLRGLFVRAFTPSVVASLRARIEQLVERLLSSLEGRESFDFIAHFAYPLPALVICEVLGVPSSDLDDIRAWSDAVATFIGLPKKPLESYEAALEADSTMAAYFRRHVAEKRDRPTEDLISRLIAARDEAGVGDDQIIATCGLLLFAAHTTTTHLLGNGLLALLRCPAELQRLRERPELVPGAVEELLRFDGPIQAVRRTALESCELGDRSIAAGELVFLMINAANRDPEAFSEPDRLDVARDNRRHLAFGGGPHFCSGAALARLEAEMAFRALAGIASDWSMADAPLRWLDNFGFRGLRELHLSTVARSIP